MLALYISTYMILFHHSNVARFGPTLHNTHNIESHGFRDLSVALAIS